MLLAERTTVRTIVVSSTENSIYRYLILLMAVAEEERKVWRRELKVLLMYVKVSSRTFIIIQVCLVCSASGVSTVSSQAVPMASIQPAHDSGCNLLHSRQN